MRGGGVNNPVQRLPVGNVFDVFGLFLQHKFADVQFRHSDAPFLAQRYNCRQQRKVAVNGGILLALGSFFADKQRDVVHGEVLQRQRCVKLGAQNIELAVGVV